MTKTKCLATLRIYRDFFEGKKVPKLDVPHDLVGPTQAQSLAHAHGMLDQMEQFIREDRMEKFFRWLGFVQGILWSLGIYPLEDLKNHNRPESS